MHFFAIFVWRIRPVLQKTSILGTFLPPFLGGFSQDLPGNPRGISLLAKLGTSEDSQNYSKTSIVQDWLAREWEDRADLCEAQEAIPLDHNCANGLGVSDCVHFERRVGFQDFPYDVL